jgi:ADP-ribose pyrophosphatase YjhB (NUDIX family)
MSSLIWKPHVTVAAVIERNGQFLFVEEETPDGLRFNQPAGHLEFGESLVDGVIRETLEETRHDFTPSALLGVYLMPTRMDREAVTYLRFAFTGTLGQEHLERTLDSGIVTTRWLSRADLIERRAAWRSPLLLNCVDDYLAGHRIPLDRLHAVWPSATEA